MANGFDSNSNLSSLWDQWQIRTIFNDYYQNELELLTEWGNKDFRPKDLIKKYPVVEKFGNDFLVYMETFTIIFEKFETRSILF